MLGLGASAMASKNEPPTCKLYTGIVTLESLKKRESHLKDELLHSASAASGDHCEIANIHYKLARMLPDQAGCNISIPVSIILREPFSAIPVPVWPIFSRDCASDDWEN